jgi:hypothetical protein
MSGPCHITVVPFVLLGSEGIYGKRKNDFRKNGKNAFWECGAGGKETQKKKNN